MDRIVDLNTDEILKKYGAKIETQMKGFDGSDFGQKKYSQSYEKFKGSMMPEFSKYERWCKTLGGLFKIKVGKKDNEKLTRDIEIAHLNITPSEAIVLATMVLFFTLFGGILFFVAIWLLTDAISLILLFLVFVLYI